jgi:vacuolar-type H+-ATPase subunit F/Vma7
MSTVVALGNDDRLDGFALAGATIVRAGTDDELVAAWERLDADVGLLILTSDAATALASVLGHRPDILTTVLP